MKCVILQPSYIPWRGYFHQILKADVFVFYDDVQYDKRGWRNRNRIKTPQGTQWLTIPVLNKGTQSEHLPINSIKINWDRAWNEEHWKSIQYSYHKAPFFDHYAALLESFYRSNPVFLADFTIELTIALVNELSSHSVQFIRSSSLGVEGMKTERLIAILKKIGADHYISGPSAKDYIDPQQFSAAGISLEYMEYNYPEYQQLYPPFDPQVSIIDLLLMQGKNAIQYILAE